MDQTSSNTQTVSPNPAPLRIPHVNATTVDVSIRSPEKLIFQGKAASVSSFNTVGPFDILPEHENFISLVKTKIIIHKDNINKQEFPIESGILKVKDNQVFIFLGVETLEANATKIVTAPTPQTKT